MVFHVQRDDKMRELILYIALRCHTDEHFGKTKLNKLLFFADFQAYDMLGRSITNMEYQALDQGPAPRAMVPLLKQLVESHDLIVQDVPRFSYTQSRPIALRSPDLSIFTADEIALVDGIISQYWDFTATQMSDATHELDGWKLADPGETIPFGAVFEVTNDIPPAALAFARELAGTF